MSKNKLPKECIFCKKVLSYWGQRKKNTKMCKECFVIHLAGKQRLGSVPWNKGKKMTIETRVKNSVAMKERWEKGSPWKDGKHPALGKKSPQIGYKRTEETRIKMSLAKTKLESFDGFRGDNKNILRKIRVCAKYFRWRKEILIRDNHSCIECGSKENLNVDHHPVDFLDIIRNNNINSIERAENCPELWSLKNGRTLCLDCHCKKHPFMTKLFNRKLILNK